MSRPQGSYRHGVNPSDQPVGPPRPGVLEEELDDELVLYHPATNQVTALNRTAADVWLLSNGKYTSDEIVSRLAGSYGVDPAQIRSDVERAIEMLRAADLFSVDQAR